MSFKSVIKKLGDIGAKTLVAGLHIGGGKIGKLAADTIADALGLNSKDDNFSERVSEMLDTEEGRLKILSAENNFKLKSMELLNAAEKMQLEDGVVRFAEAQASYRAELEYGKATGDNWVSRTRPLIIRELFKLSKIMVFSLIGSACLDILTDWILMARCSESNVEIVQGCWQFIQDRTSFSVRISLMYKDNWIWLSPLFGIFVTWFGGRTYEKKHSITKARTSDE